MITTRTPLRISFFGGGTDYPVWYREYGGSVLATTIDKSCYVTCRWLPPFFEYHSRITYSQYENVIRNQDIRHPSVRGCLQFMGLEEGVEIHHIADLPARTGLGTSSAFTVGLLLGLYALKNQMRDRRSLASDAIFVEQEVIGEAVGAQDQISAAYGGFNRIDFARDGTIEAKPVLASASRLRELEDHLVLYFTGFSRIASEIAQGADQADASPRKTELELMHQMVDEGQNVVLGPNRSLDEFGKLLHEGWKVKRSLTGVSNLTSMKSMKPACPRGTRRQTSGRGWRRFYAVFCATRAAGGGAESSGQVPLTGFRFSNKGSQVVVYEPEEIYDQALARERLRVYAGRAASAIIVLCGAGTRLRTVTDGPKAMVSVGGRPFLEILCQLRRWGIERVILAVGYQRDTIRDHFGDEAFGLHLVYSPELTPLGTGGALRNAANPVASSTILVLNGDSYTNAGLDRFSGTTGKTDVSVLVVPPDGREDCGTVSMEADGRLLDFQEKQRGTGRRYVNAGIYLVSREILHEIPSGQTPVSLERELLPKWLARSRRSVQSSMPRCVTISAL